MGPATENLYTVQLTKALETDRRIALRKWANLLREHQEAAQPQARERSRLSWRPRQLRRTPSVR